MRDIGRRRDRIIFAKLSTDFLLFSPVARFYLKSGITISNVTKFVQYQPHCVLKNFAEHVTKMRTEAEINGEKTKSLTAKIFGNSGYGKVCMKNLILS